MHLRIHDVRRYPLYGEKTASKRLPVAWGLRARKMEQELSCLLLITSTAQPPLSLLTELGNELWHFGH